MHTYDKSDLLGLSEKVMRADGVPLKICTPYVPEPPLPIPIPSSSSVPAQQGALSLEESDENDEEASAR
jgi:hypothetical protein